MLTDSARALLAAGKPHSAPSCTIGQWDATEGRELSGGDWHLTGGFWGLILEELADLLFHDRFEED